MGEQFCFICSKDPELKNKIKANISLQDNRWNYNCPLCGNYSFMLETKKDPIKNMLKPLAPHLDSNLLKFKEDFYLLRGYVRNMNEKYPDEFVEIPWNKDKFKQLISDLQHYKDFDNKIDNFLLFLKQKLNHLGDNVLLSMEMDYPLLYVKNQEEFQTLIEEMSNQEHIEVKHGFNKKINGNEYNSFQTFLTIEGYRYLKKENIDSKQIFVAMQLREDKINPKDIFSEMEEEIKEKTGFELLWMGTGETMLNVNKIDDEIISQIRKSKFIIADLTYYNRNVLYEAGFGKGIGRDILYTCEEDWFEKNKEECPFDIRQFNIWKWKKDNPNELIKRIISFINSRK